MLTKQQVATQKGLSLRRIRQLLKAGRITGAHYFMGKWGIEESFTITKVRMGRPPRRRVN